MSSTAILLTAAVGLIASVVTAYVTAHLTARQEMKRWHTELAGKYAELVADQPAKAQALARQFVFGRYQPLRRGPRRADEPFVVGILADQGARVESERAETSIDDPHPVFPNQGFVSFLLASCEFGKIDQLPWPQKSPTKNRVAGQRNPDASQPSLFDDLAPEEIGRLEGNGAPASRPCSTAPGGWASLAKFPTATP